MRRKRLVGLSKTFSVTWAVNRKALEKRDSARLLAGFRGAPTFVVRGEPSGIDDSGSPFALPDVAAEPERLAKGEPVLSGEAALDNGAPQDQHIDPGISALRGRVARHRERRLDRHRSPWLHPGDTPGLQFGDDLVSDFSVKARTIIAGTDSCGGSGHRGSPRRAPEASLPTFNPSRQTRSALSLSTALTP